MKDYIEDMKEHYGEEQDDDSLPSSDEGNDAMSEDDGNNDGDGDDDGSEDDGDDNDDDEDTDGFDEEGYEELDGEATENLKRKFLDEDDEPSKSARIAPEDRHLYKLPTLDEMNRLRETQTLYHSSLFRMQMEELLLEINMKNKHRHGMIQWVNKFTSFIKSLPPSPVYQLSMDKWLKEKQICGPFSLPKGKGTFQFMPPTDVKFTGSFAVGTVLTSDEAVDVMLILPKEFVQYKDYKNGRWLSKRTKYLSWLASHLQSDCDLVISVRWTYHLGKENRPILQVTPSGSIGKKWKINILPVPCPESMKLSYFSPEKWTVTPSWYFQKEVEEEHEATPQINWSNAVDVVMQDHLQLIADNISPHSNVVQGIKLIKFWLAKRGLNKGYRRVSAHLITMLAIHLLQTRKINTQMSGYQVFRAFILTLVDSDWTSKGLCMKNDMSEDLLSLEKLHELYEVVFMDPSGRVNMAASLMSEDFFVVKHEAKLALETLNTSSADSFEFLFMRKVEFPQVSDQMLSIFLSIDDCNSIVDKSPNTKQQTLDHFGNVRLPAYSFLLKTLKEGLGDRVALLVPRRDNIPVWRVEKNVPDMTQLFVVGLVINETAAKALLTKGPSADDPAAKNFRSFWGEKSSMRRFQDGSFHEAVLWENVDKSIGDRRLIPGLVAKYVLSYHYGLKPNCVRYICNQTELFLRSRISLKTSQYGTGEEATAMAIQAFDSFSRKLRSLDLPLNVTSVQTTSDVGRHARVFPPLAKALKMVEHRGSQKQSHHQLEDPTENCPSFTYAINVNVFLETSGKWPDELVAIQAIKAEFYKQIANLLQADSITALAYPKSLQVLWEGYIFQVKVGYRREIYLNRLVPTPDGDLREEDTVSAINLEKDLEIMPRLTSALASVQADHPSYSSGVRLVKRWMSSQLLFPHVPPIAVELLVAYLHICPAPYTTPHTPHVVFMRFLSLLAYTDWKTTPIFINLRNNFAEEDITELNRRFTSERSSLPEMFIATPYELRGLSTSTDPNYYYKLASLWTKDAPSLPIIYRCKQLAKASLDSLTGNTIHCITKVKTIFRPCLDDFNVLIKLNEKQLSRRCESVDCRKKVPKAQPYHYSNEEVMPVVMFDPAQLYLEELRAAFDHIALFFHDEHGGDVIGVVWKPSALEENEFKVGNFEAHRVIGIKAVKQVYNMEAILSDFEIIGSGLVENVIVNDKK